MNGYERIDRTNKFCSRSWSKIGDTNIYKGYFTIHSNIAANFEVDVSQKSDISEFIAL